MARCPVQSGSAYAGPRSEVITRLTRNVDLGRRFESEPAAVTALPLTPLERLLAVNAQRAVRSSLTRQHANQRSPRRLLSNWHVYPGFFDRVSNCITIMQDHITLGSPASRHVIARHDCATSLCSSRRQMAASPGRSILRRTETPPVAARALPSVYANIRFRVSAGRKRRLRQVDRARTAPARRTLTSSS